MADEDRSLKYRLTECFELIRTRQFDEGTLRLLLIDIREMFTGQPIVREVADFVAHRQRDVGIFHAKIASRFFRVEKGYNEIQKLDLSDPQPGVTFDDLLWAAHDPEDIRTFPRSFFETVFLHGINDFDPDFLVAVTGIRPSQIRVKLEKAYKKKAGTYSLRPSHESPELSRLMWLLYTSIQFVPIFSVDRLIEELMGALSQVTQRFQMEPPPTLSIEQIKSDLTVATLSLIKDAKFVVNGREVGKAFFTSEKGQLCLACEFQPFARPFRFPLVSTNMPLESVTDKDCADFEELPVAAAIRTSKGKLELK